jgi:hypothetical protein
LDVLFRFQDFDHFACGVLGDDISGRTFNEHATLVHDHEAVAKLSGLLHVMSCQKESDSLPLQRPQTVPHQVPRLGIETSRRLVQH